MTDFQTYFGCFKGKVSQGKPAWLSNIFNFLDKSFVMYTILQFYFVF